ncbi:dUTP diphosphatase [Bacillus toyonensis]
MKLQKLFEMQKLLDKRIIKEHGLEAVNLLEEKLLALQVEIAELANETRCFKYWSNKEASPKERILDEYVDGLHLFLSICLLLKMTDIKIDSDYTEVTTVKTFNRLFQWVSDLSQTSICFPNYLKNDVEMCFNLFIGLGEKHLGFTWEEIEQAYIEKNEVNHQRQDNGY